MRMMQISSLHITIFALSYDGVTFGQSNTVSVQLTTNIAVNKVWNGGPEDGKVPVEVELLRDGQSIPAPEGPKILTLSEDNQWNDTFLKLPILGPLGETYRYSVVERTQVPHYDNVAITGNEDDGFTITNTYTSPTFSTTGTKIWDKGPSPDDFQVVFQMYRWVGNGDLTDGPNGADDPNDEFINGELVIKEATGEPHVVNKSTNWKFTEDFDRYRQSDGAEYHYVMREVTTGYTVIVNPERYTKSLSDQKVIDDNGILTEWNFDITNKYQSPMISIRGSKFWYGGQLPHPTPTFQLFQYYKETENWLDGRPFGEPSSGATTANPYKDYQVPLTDEYGVEYDYLLGEISDIPNYISSRNWEGSPAMDIINTYVSPRVEIEGLKTWVGGEELGSRPDVEFQLMQNGVPYVPVPTLTGTGVKNSLITVSLRGYERDFITKVQEDGRWILEMPGLDAMIASLDPEFQTAPLLRATQTENEKVASSAIVWQIGTGGTGGEVINQGFWANVINVGNTTVTGTGFPTATVSVTFPDGTTANTTVDADGNWSIPVSGSLVDGQKVEMVYTIDDWVKETRRIVGEVDLADRESVLPMIESLSTDVNPKPLVEDKVTWDVPLTDFFEQKYNYQVIEYEVPDNYTDTYAEPVRTPADPALDMTKLSQTVTNTYTPDTIQVTAKKVWEGGPEVKPGFEFQLYREPVEEETERVAVGAPVAMLTKSSHTWDVPERSAKGTLYTYYVEESTPPVNYKPSYLVVEEVEDKLTIVNTFDPAPLTIPVQKNWDGGSQGDRPASIEVGLYIDDTLAQDEDGQDLLLTLTPDVNGVWFGEFTNVPSIDVDLNPITYTMKETIPDGFRFEPTYEGDQTRGFRVINTYVPEIADVVFTKEWVGGKSTQAIELQLLRNLVKFGEPVTIDGAVDAQNEPEAWKATWKGLPVQDMTGTDYVYTVREVTVPTNYQVEYDQENKIVTNTFVPELVSFTANKVWDGGPIDHPTVVFQLYRTLGDDLTTKEAVDDAIFAKGDTHTWTNLPKTDINGVDYSYFVEEENVPADYVSKPGVVTGNTQTITNEYQVKTTTITGTKVWVDGPDVKPNITLVLEQRIGENGNRTDIGEIDLTNGNLTAVWENMPVTDINGNLYIYTVREKEVPANYTVSYDGLTATNTYAIPKDGEVEATKIWDGGPAVNRPDVYFELYRQVGTGTPTRVPNTDTLTVSTPDNETEAKVAWTGLETKDAKGQDYIFTVREVGTPTGYTKSESGLTVTNKYNVDTTSFTVEKKWVGGPEAKPTVAMQLYQGTENPDTRIALGSSVALADGTTSYT